MRIFLFGAGKNIEDTIREIQTVDCFEEVKICGILDNDSSKEGNLHEGVRVFLPSKIYYSDYDMVIICINSFDSVKEQLKAMGIDENSVESFFRWKMIMHSKGCYGKKYKNKSVKKENIFNGKTVIYTALFGNLDFLHDPEVIGNADYVLFTNNKEIKSTIWNIEYIPYQDLSDRLMARRYKILPHKYFSEYETSIWVDAKFLIKRSLTDYVETYQRDVPVLCFPHPLRDCIYEEAAECIHFGIGIKEDILRQIVAYYHDQYPIDAGLYETGCMVRRHNDEVVMKLMEDWFSEVKNYSYRDQISFPYVCRRNQIEPDICDLYIDDNPYLYMARYNF